MRIVLNFDPLANLNHSSYTPYVDGKENYLPLLSCHMSLCRAVVNNQKRKLNLNMVALLSPYMVETSFW